MSESKANKIYDVLTTTCGASEHWRENFVFQMAEGCDEYRFQGDLGFGGKLYNNCRGLYVDCYTEDRNEQRAAAIAEANTLLKNLTEIL